MDLEMHIQIQSKLEYVPVLHADLDPIKAETRDSRRQILRNRIPISLKHNSRDLYPHATNSPPQSVPHATQPAQLGQINQAR
jgi:hypothetical protein